MFLLATCIAIEHIAVIERFTLRQRFPGVLMNLVGTVLGIGLVWPVHRLWINLGISPVMVPLWPWLKPLGLIGYALQFLTLIVVADFLAYWRHRAEHTKWLWPIHKVHHSPTELHAANDIGHPVQGFFSLAFITIPMSVIQIDGPAMPWAVGAVVAFLAIYIHSPIDFHFGPLRRVIVDNRYHRLHHSLEPRHIDKNFGICLNIWDRMFGTAVDPLPGEWPKVGVAGLRPPRTVRDFLLMPLRDPPDVEVREVVVDAAAEARIDAQAVGGHCRG